VKRADGIFDLRGCGGAWLAFYSRPPAGISMPRAVSALAISPNHMQPPLRAALQPRAGRRGGGGCKILGQLTNIFVVL
jgi:hypothetical protein